MTDQVRLRVESAELRRLIEAAGDDPILRPQLDERLQDVESELSQILHEPGTLLPIELQTAPRAAVFLRGGGVFDSSGIRPTLAGEALIQYERMFTEQALHDEREAAKRAGRQRRPRGAAMPGLLFTGTPRGSFGLEFVPEPSDDFKLAEVHAKSLHNVADAIAAVTDRDLSPLSDSLQAIPTRVLRPLKLFLRTLANYGAELRLAFHNERVRTISADKVRIAAEQLERDVEQEDEKYRGVFRGVTRESGWFDLRTEDGRVITGTVADSFTEDDLERIHKLTNQDCWAILQKTTVSSVGGNSTTTYVLMDANAVKGHGES